MAELSPGELARLERFLTAHSERFALALVRVWGPATQLEQWVREFSISHERPFRIVDAANLQPLAVWEQLAQQGLPGCIVLMVRADEAFHEENGRLLSLLNRQREQIGSLCPGPFLLLAGDSALARFQQDAPDLADWHAATFDFAANAPADRTAESDSSGFSGLPYEQIESRIRLLQSQARGTLTDLERAGLLRELANLSRERGRYEEAETLYLESSAIRQRFLGLEHPDTITSINDLAGMSVIKGDFEEAEPALRRDLAVQERVLGPEHPDTLRSVSNLGLVLAHKGEYSAAELLLRRALEGMTRALGPEHPDALRSVANLASLLSRNGEYVVAEPLLRQAFEARARVLGAEHPDTLTSATDLAALYAVQGRYAEAGKLFVRALKGAEKILGDHHPTTQQFRANLQNFRDRLNA